MPYYSIVSVLANYLFHLSPTSHCIIPFLCHLTFIEHAQTGFIYNGWSEHVFLSVMLEYNYHT